MSLDTDLKLKHDVLQIEKGKRRRRYARNIVISFVLVILSYVAITYLSFNANVAVFFAITLLGSIMVFLIYTYSYGPRIWSPLTPMEQAFESLYEALSKTWPATNEANEPTQDETYIKDYIRKLLGDASKRLGAEEAGEALADETGKLLDRTQDNIEDRLIPALGSSKLSSQTITSLAKVFGSPTFESLKSINSTMETDYQAPLQEPIESPIKKQLSELRKRGIFGLLMSILIGYGTAGLILQVIGLFLQEDALAFTRGQVAPLVGAGAVLSALYAQVLRKSAKEE